MKFSLLLPVFASPFLLPFVVRAEELTGVRAPAAGPCPSVEEARAMMTVPDGYEVRCFASEPMVVNPVAMTWDHRGRLWVVELYEYPSGAKQPNEYSKTATDENFRPVVKTDASSPRDRVIVLEDTDNDGKADKRTVFAEGLNLATAILCGYDGVFVGQAPNMLFFRDTDGDDKADEYKTVLTGFGLEDRHELLNSFTWGPDGYMYFTHGVFTHSRVRRPAEPEDAGNTLTAGVYRVRFGKTQGQANPAERSDAGPHVTFHEVFADGTSNPWGVDFDARGNAFVEACVIDHLFHMAPGGIYARQGGAPENPYTYELLPSIVQPDQPKHFRAAYAGISIYQGGVYPKDTEGHAFFGNIHDNAIHEEALDPSGSTFKARPVRDFLRANNGWFRPVSIQTGPDGFLWVMDWCDKYPCYQNAQANPEGVNRDKGRIWRVCYTGSEEGKKLAGMSRGEAVLELGDLPLDQLPAKLTSTNNWVRKMAARLIDERPMAGDSDRQAATALETLFESKPAQEARRAASWALGTGRIDALMSRKTHLACATDQDPVLRVWAARFEGDCFPAQTSNWPKKFSNEPFRTGFPTLETLASDTDPSVLAATAIALRQKTLQHLCQSGVVEDYYASSFDPPQLPYHAAAGYIDRKAFTSLISNRPQSFAADRTLMLHIWMALEPNVAALPQEWLPWLADLAPKAKPLSEILTYKAARRITDTRNAENMDLLLGFLEKIKADDTLTARALEGMLKAQEAGALKPATVDPAGLFAHWAKSDSEKVRRLAGRLATLWGDPKAVAALMGTALDSKADLTQRIEAIRTARRLKSGEARAGIRKLLAEKTPDALTVEVLRAAGELGGLDLANEVLKAWQGYSSGMKTAAAEVMATRQDWAGRLLDAVEGKWIASGKINASDIPVSVRRSLAQDDALKGRARDLLGAWNESGDDMKALIAAKKKAALTGEPDMANGKLLFTTTCATCHKFHGGGQEVGPELIGSGRSNLDAILANVIDPNQIIGNGYENFIVTTADGRAVAGRVVEDTPTQMTLLGIGGVKTVVPRGEIKESVNTHQSLMPMGFGGLADADFRDLVWYILAPPEEGPLTPEKREHFTTSIDQAESATAPTAASQAIDFASPKLRDRESASLWNPDWQLDAADFEGTPTKLVDWHGQKNVLVLHPKSRTEPGALVRTLTLPADKPMNLSVRVASHDHGDWDLRATCNGALLPGGGRVHHDQPDQRWRQVTWDLNAWQGKEVTLRLENHASGWNAEFSFWSDLQLTPR